MNNALKSLENNTLAALSARAPAGIVNAIKTASAKTGVSFSYLMEKAAAESNFNPTVKAKTSSATGLFQFIESTWMDMVNKHGAKYGINTNASKSELLNLRKDPEIASCMAAEFAQDNKCYLEKTVGGDIGDTELYFAHFMGAGGASAFLNQHKKNPLSIGADLFPKEARANKGVFYDSKTGQPRTLEQIYNFFDKKFVGGEGQAAPTTTNNLSSKNARSKNTGGYQHIPPSLQKPIEIRQNGYAQVINSIYRTPNNADAFFAPPSSNRGMTGLIPTSMYGNLNHQTSILLNLLRD